MSYSQTYGSGGGYMVGSQDSPSQETKKSNYSGVRPVTILTLLNATQAHTDAPYTVEGVEIGQVTIVAQLIEDIEPQSTNILFKLDDGTSRIDARHWLEASEPAESYSHMKDKSYIRVMGSMKTLGGKRHLNAPHVRLATPREFVFHRAETLLAYAQTFLVPSSGTTSVTAGTTTTDTSAYMPGAASTTKTNTSDHPNYAHLPILERNILDFMQKSPGDNNGVHVRDIVVGLASINITADKLVTALDRLVDEGHVFTTCDDEHYKVS